MAKALRGELARRGVTVTHGECLDIVARQFGLADWNVLAARLADPASATLGSATLGSATLGSATLGSAGPASGDGAPGPALALPDGWAFEGSRLDYEVGVDPGAPRGAGRSALIRTRFALGHPGEAAARGCLGALYQELDAAAYRGQRLRLQAELRTAGVVGAATIWLQVDRSRRRDVLALDNLEGRAVDGPLTGTQGWTTRRVVLDVPAEAVVVHYGFYLRGSGSAWAAGFSLGEADAGEAVTTAPARLLPAPVNLDFAGAPAPAA